MSDEEDTAPGTLINHLIWIVFFVLALTGLVYLTLKKFGVI
jgi:hypothetical protein